MVPGPTTLPISTRPKNAYLLLAASLGIIVGLFIGNMVIPPRGHGRTAEKVAERQNTGVQGADYSAAFKVVNASTSWAPAPLVWNRLGPFSKAGRAPKTFSIPPELYNYGAMTDPIPPILVKDNIILRVDVSHIEGVVGVSLVNPQGNPLVTEEQSVTKDDRERAVLFLVRPEDLPASVLLRNYGDQTGNKGTITVDNVSLAPVSAFSDAEMQAMKAMGLNKSLK